MTFRAKAPTVSSKLLDREECFAGSCAFGDAGPGVKGLSIVMGLGMSSSTVTGMVADRSFAFDAVAGRAVVSLVCGSARVPVVWLTATPRIASPDTCNSSRSVRSDSLPSSSLKDEEPDACSCFLREPLGCLALRLA